MQAEPLGALTCAPALRLQGIARIELLNEGVTVFPADDAVGEETGCSWTSTWLLRPESAPGPRDLLLTAV